MHKHSESGCAAALGIGLSPTLHDAFFDINAGE
jgi:hypothetical protein